MQRRMILVALTSIACNSEACGPAVLGDLPMTDGMDGSAGESGDTPREWSTVATQEPRQIDILFVIDDGETMASRQARLVDTAQVFVDILEEFDVEASYRIGFTTTDIGGPACGPGSLPESGALVATSCRDRLSDFRKYELDAMDEGCRDRCAHEEIDILPTQIGDDPVAAPRPWLERIDGVANVSIDPAEAFACMAPQGIAGCELASPLEAMALALASFRDPQSRSYGFVRERAHLFVVVVTDGPDCSLGLDGGAIVEPLDDCDPVYEPCVQTFWTDPSAEAPTEGVCWNAGVTCSGAAPGPDGTTLFDDCVAADKDRYGAATPPELAMLYTTDRYAAMLDELREEKAALGFSVFVVAIAGDPPGFAPPTFATAADPAEQIAWGIAPGCRDTDGVGVATPPVRLDALIDPDGRYSICEDDYSPALGSIANSVRTQLRPACFDRCAADLDPTTPDLELDCEAREAVPFPDGDDVHEIPQCLPDESLPDGANVCWLPLVDDARTDYCTELGSNVELELVRREGHPALDGARIEMSCVLSEQPDVDCPGL
jgi:hypothetical protein